MGGWSGTVLTWNHRIDWINTKAVVPKVKAISNDINNYLIMIIRPFKITFLKICENQRLCIFLYWNRKLFGKQIVPKSSKWFINLLSDVYRSFIQTWSAFCWCNAHWSLSGRCLNSVNAAINCSQWTFKAIMFLYGSFCWTLSYRNSIIWLDTFSWSNAYWRQFLLAHMSTIESHFLAFLGLHFWSVQLYKFNKISTHKHKH